MSEHKENSPVLVHATISTEFDDNVAVTRELKLKECKWSASPLCLQSQVKVKAGITSTTTTTTTFAGAGGNPVKFLSHFSFVTAQQPHDEADETHKCMQSPKV